jgi:hypothetical protein
MEAQFRNALANSFDIAGVSRHKPFDPDQYARSRLNIVQPIEPFRELLGFAIFHRSYSVALRIQIVNVKFKKILSLPLPSARERVSR